MNKIDRDVDVIEYTILRLTFLLVRSILEIDEFEVNQFITAKINVMLMVLLKYCNISQLIKINK